MRTQAALLDHLNHPRPYTESQPLRLTDVDIDDPGPGELLVAVDAVGVCHSDLSVVDGTRPRPTPMALGHEATGIVEAVGPHVTDVVVGDRVVLVFVASCGLCAVCASGRPAQCRNGVQAGAEGTLLSGARRLRRNGDAVNHHLGVSGFARHSVVDRRSAVVVEKEIPAHVAALFGCAVLTGVGAVLNTAQVRPGESAAVVGLGGVGLAAVLGAVLTNAHPIIAVDPVPAKRDLALKIGATTAATPEEATATVADITVGGADVVFEAAGRTAALQTAWSLTRRGGRTVSMGLPDPSESLAIPIAELVGQGRIVAGSYLGDAIPQRDIPRYIALWRAGKLPVDVLHSGSRPLSEINTALEDLATGSVVRQVLIP